MLNVENKKLEVIGKKMVLVAAALVLLGFFVGSFVSFVIYVAVFGSVLFMLGILIFIFSKLFEEEAKPQ